MDSMPAGRAALTTVTAAATVLLVMGCSARDGGTTSTTDSPAPSATPASLTFEQATAALTEDLVPPEQFSRCDEYLPGSPEAEEYLSHAAAEQEAAEADAATSDEGATPKPSPTLPQCGNPALDDLRAAEVIGFTFAAGEEITIPVAGGASRLVDVYEMADPDAAAALVEAQAADAEGWAVNQEIPREDRADGTYVPRQVITGAAVADVALPGWTGTVLSRDSTSFQDDGTAAGDASSEGYLWAARDAIAIRVQVAGDEPGRAAATVTDTARRFVAGIDG
jgi:hypothetical protein